MTTKTTAKTRISQSVNIERNLKGPMLNTGQKFSKKKRNPITASAKGWPAPKRRSK